MFAITLLLVLTIVSQASADTGTKFEAIQDMYTWNKPERIKFPTISICSMNKVKKSYIEAPENKAIKEYLDILERFAYNRSIEIAERFDNPEDYMYSIKDMLYEDLIENGGPTKDRLLQCIQKMSISSQLPAFNDNPDRAYVMENSIIGKCWRVNPDGKMMGKMGDYGALTLKFWADVQDYSTRSRIRTVSQGFLVKIHDNTTYGVTVSTEFLMSPGTHYKANLKRVQAVRDIENCDPSLTENTYGAYNEGSCALECKDKALYEKCGCVDVVPPLNNGKYKSCTLKQWLKCGYVQFLEWHVNYTDTDRASNFCPCPTACKEVRYEAQISSSSVSPVYADRIFDSVRGLMSYRLSKPEFDILYNTTEDLLKNIMVLEITFSSMMTSEIREIINYDMSNFIGTGDCEDDHKKCDQWARSGFCTNDDYRDYVTTTCQKSCNSCQREEEATEEASEEATPELITHSMVSQSSTDKVKKNKMEARFAVDGDDSTRSQTKCSKRDAWFRYKFEEASRVTGVEILSAKLNGALVFAVEVDGLKKKCGQILGRSSSSKADQTYIVDCAGIYAYSIEIVQRTKYKNKKCLELKEVRVYGFPGEGSTEE